MKVLVVGGGGREHALAWKLAGSEMVEKLYAAPGNAGIAQHGECLPVSAEDIGKLVETAVEKQVDLVVVGPEAPLVKGLANELEKKGIMVFGCSQKAARIEGSKVFAKELMKKHGIPTADFQVFDEPGPARSFIEKQDRPMVIKADGLAAGKGVIVCDNKQEALDAVSLIMEQKAFGDAGDRIVIEERLYGEEASFLAFTDGETIIPMPSSQDHKQIYDGDKGPNTGGMGAYSPAPVITEKLKEIIMKDIMEKTVRAMEKEGSPYRGVLYAGLMITKEGPKVLEFNARFGDPEAQPLLFRMESDLVPALLACAKADGSLRNLPIKWSDKPAVCVVMASKGYPGKYEKGHEIKGLDKAAELPDTFVFHAGTKREGDRILTAGGRVLGVTARGGTIKEAIDNAYKAVRLITWPGAYFRTDIGQKALAKASL